MKKKIVLGSILILAATGVVLGFTLFRADKNNGIHYKTETIERGRVESLVITTGALNPVMQVDIGSQVDLTYTVIKSPVDGVVIDRKVNVGQTVAASMQAPVLFRIAQDLSQMQVECSIDEADIGTVKEGQDVQFSVDAYPDESFVGTISQVRYSPEITQNVVTYTTIVEVANPEFKLLPGMTATVSVIVEQAEAVLLIPNAALRYSPVFKSGPESGSLSSNKRKAKSPDQKREDSQRIWILDENSNLKPVPVKTGVTDNSYSELLEGMLAEGQIIVTGEDTTSTKTFSSNQSSSINQMMRMIR